MNNFDDYTTIARTVAEAMPDEPPVKHPATVIGYDTTLGIVTVRMDGDTALTTAENLTGQIFLGGQRVMCEFVPPHGVYVVGVAGTSIGEWLDYTPVLSGTGWAIGNGTIAGRYVRLGDFVAGQAVVDFGSTSTYGSPDRPQLSLPVTGSTALSSNLEHGLVRLHDSGSAEFLGSFRRVDANTISIFAEEVATYVRRTSVTATVPFTWTTGDRIEVHFWYEAA